LSEGKLDTNFMVQPSLFPSEVDDSLIDYTKGCYVGQEVVSRMNHKQKNKKIIKIYKSEQLKSIHLPASHKTLLEIDGYTIIKEPVE
jgi:folate-binding protein YgfZ